MGSRTLGSGLERFGHAWFCDLGGCTYTVQDGWKPGFPVRRPRVLEGLRRLVSEGFAIFGFHKIFWGFGDAQVSGFPGFRYG